MARGGSASTYEDARDEALTNGEHRPRPALDEGIAPTYGIADAVDSHIVWWPSDRALCSGQFRWHPYGDVAVPTLTVTDPKGQSFPTAPSAAARVRDESFTYFRLAQLTDELFDAFRNIYLAIEAILSSIVPPNPNEGENKWLKRALLAVHPQLVDLASFAPAGGLIRWLRSILSCAMREMRCSMQRAIEITSCLRSGQTEPRSRRPSREQHDYTCD